jgi:ornithine cyclodeaminase/alanine dehydrogenase-like protein (mu-crystallin family)
MRSGSIVTDNREEESEIGEIQVAPALQTIVQFQQIHLLQEAMDGCNNNIKQSKRL